MLAYFAMILVEKQDMSFNICRCSRSVPCGVMRLPRYAATTCRSYGSGVQRYHATLLLFPTSLHNSIVPCGGMGLRRYTVPSLLDCKYFVINS